MKDITPSSKISEEKEATSHAGLQPMRQELLNNAVGWLIERLFSEEERSKDNDLYTYIEKSHKLLFNVGANFFSNISSFDLFEDTENLEFNDSPNNENPQTLAICIARISIAAFSFYQYKDDIGDLRLKSRLESEIKELDKKTREKNEEKEKKRENEEEEEEEENSVRVS